MFRWRNASTEPYTSEAAAIASSSVRKYDVGSGNFAIAIRRKPYVPAFATTPESTALTSGGASPYASGSQPWKGKSGDLIVNASAKPRKTQRLAPARHRRPDRRELDPAADHGEDRQQADRDHHRQRALAAEVTVVVLADERRRLAREDEVVEAERVHAREEGACERGEPEDPAVPGTDAHRGGDDRVFREEAGERRQPDERERAGEEAPARERHQPADALHLPDVLLAPERVDDEPGRHEEQRLEERVRHQVELAVRVRAEPGAEEHVADLRHRRVGNDALDVRLDERDEAGDEKRQRARAGGDQLDHARLLEDRVRARDQVDTGGHHRRGADQAR